MSSMPLILAIETATLACSVAIFEGERVIAHRHDIGPSYVHAERHLPFIDHVLRKPALPAKS